MRMKDFLLSKANLLDRLFTRRGPEKRELLNAPGPVKLTNGIISQILGFGGVKNMTPITVSPGTAMSVPAYFSAVSFLSGTVAGLPLHTFETTVGKGTRKRSTKPISRVIGSAVNPGLTSFEWRRIMMSHVLRHERHVSYIERDARGQVVNLFPLAPGSFTVKGHAYAKEYHTKDARGKDVAYKPEEVIDIVFNHADDMLNATGTLQGATNALGLFLAATKYGAKVFDNGGLPPLVVSGPFASVGAGERAADDIPRALAERERSGSQALALPAGHELKTLGLNAEEMQLTDLKRFCVEEIARVFSLPPVFLQDLANGVRSDSEQQDLHFVKHTLRRWTEQIEAELNLKLFGRDNKKMSVEFNLDGILRGDFKTRMEGFAKAVASGLITPNEARALDNREPVEGGDAAYIQGAMMPLKNQQNADLKSSQDKNATTTEPGADDGGED